MAQNKVYLIHYDSWYDGYDNPEGLHYIVRVCATKELAIQEMNKFIEETKQKVVDQIINSGNFEYEEIPRLIDQINSFELKEKPDWGFDITHLYVDNDAFGDNIYLRIEEMDLIEA